mgnify:CR=1 FL=1
MVSRKVIRDIADEFSLALCNLICMVHPKLIIIGGKGKDLGPVFLQEIQECLRTTGFRRMVDSVSVRYSLLDSSALYNGAMKYFLIFTIILRRRWTDASSSDKNPLSSHINGGMK